MLALLLGACSSVFTSSITGQIIDKEDAADNATTGIGNASVFLYTGEKEWEADFAAWIDGDSSTLPDAETKDEYTYFQSTVTNADGNYQFNGFVWQTILPAYGKTADRRQIYLLIYHPDYGLQKNPVPLFIVSDVTTQLDMIAIEDRWHDARVSGRVINWKEAENTNVNQRGLGNVNVQFYVAESWSFDTVGEFTDVVYPRNPTQTLISDGEGYYTGTIRFPMEPSRAAEQGKAPVRVAFERENWRANDPVDGSGLSNSGMTVDGDLDQDGRTAATGDWSDAYITVTLNKETDSAPLNSLPEVTLQQWRFTTTVRGRVKDSIPEYIDGVEVTLAVNEAEDRVVYTESQTTGDVSTSGHFNFGTVSWDLGQIVAGDTDTPPRSLLDNQKDGWMKFTITTVPASSPAETIGYLKPGVAINLELTL